MKPKTIVIVNDRDSVKGGADAVALMQADEFRQAGADVIMFTAISDKCAPIKQENQGSRLPQYELSFRNFGKNLFWVKAYSQLKRLIKQKTPDVVIVHGWTKQLSSSIFFALSKRKPFLVAHDYFLICPNGGLYNYQTRSKCSLKGGGLNCLLTQCDKANYLHKLFRWVRFWIQKCGIALSQPKIIALNELQVSLIGENNIAGVVRNRIEEPVESEINAQTVRKFVTFMGRGDPEKGIDIFLHPDFSCPFPLMLIGPEKGAVKSSKIEIVDCGWVEEQDMDILLRESLIGIFPSLWYEVDPLVPWKFIARGVPVIASEENLFGLYLKKHLPELVYRDVGELNKILDRIMISSFYEEMRNRSLELYRRERVLRVEIWEKVWHENIN